MAWKGPYAISIFFLLQLQSTVVHGSSMNRLVKHLQSLNASLYAPPLMNHDERLIVHLILGMRFLLDMKIQSHTMVSVFNLRMEWYSDFHKWNPDDYEGIKEVPLPINLFWVPDIVVFNKIRSKDIIEEDYDKFLLLNHTGRIFWTKVYGIETICEFDVTYFPFDTQNCHFHLGSWFHPSDKLDFDEHSYLTIVDYRATHEWQLLSYGVQMRHNISEGVFKGFSDLVFELKFSRRTLYYFYAIICPSVMLSILSLFQFWIPCDSGEKINLGLGILITTGVFMLMVAEKMPTSTQNIPLLGLYLTTSMALTSMSIGCAAFSCFVYHQSVYEYKLSPILEQIDGFSTKYLLANKRKAIKIRRASVYNQTLLEENIRRASVYDPTLLEENIRRTSFYNQEENTNDNNLHELIGNITHRLTSDNNHQVSEVDRLTLLSIQKELQGKRWKEASESLDRVLFHVYTVFLFIEKMTFLVIIPLNQIVKEEQIIKEFLESGKHTGPNVTV